MSSELEVQNIVYFNEKFKEIVHNIVQNRKQANLTQDQLSKIINVDRRKIISLEAGRFDLITLLKASDLLGIKIILSFEIE